MTAGSPAVGHASYRADVDGLRAVAVLAVVLYHLGVGGVSGGYVGVDVFFVISGYLITRLITGDDDRGTFSILGFYERRARRILPALFVMLGGTCLVATVILVPEAFIQFGRSVIASALSFSNFHFHGLSGYFAPVAEQRPLLHTWSLAVEEQFYVFYPAYLVAGRRWLRLPRWGLIAGVVALSFVAAVVLVAQDPSAGFYLPFGRLWELGLGGLIATATPPALAARLRHVGPALGVACIVAAAVLYDDGTTFPGVSALVPCVGAALVILGGSTADPGPISRALGWRPVVFVGLISYSLYLWHWPVIVFGKLVIARPPTPIETVGMLVLSLALAVLSWRFVERPFRVTRGHSRFSRRWIFAASGVGVASFVAFGALVDARGGVPSRHPSGVRLAAAASGDVNPRRRACDSPSFARIREGRVCVVGAEGVEPTAAILGDSLGDAIVPGIAAAAESRGVAAWVLTRAGCRPLVGLVGLDAECDGYTDATVELIERTPSIRTVVVVGRWSTMVEGVRFGFGRQPTSFLADELTNGHYSREENVRVFERSVARTVRAFAGREVVFVAYLPEQEVLVPEALTARAMLRLPDPQGVDRPTFEARHRRVRAVLEPAAARLGFRIVDVGAAACDDQRCPIVDGRGRPLYHDDNHFSRTGALGLAPLFASMFD